MEDIRQSAEYAQFMEKLGWTVERISSSDNKIQHHIFIRRFPLIGSFIKILRIKPPVLFDTIEEIAQKYKAYRVQIEPGLTIFNNPINNVQSPINNKQLTINNDHAKRGQIPLSGMSNDQYHKYGYKKAKNSFAPTKTIHIDLNPSEKKIFAGFSPEKRRAIRKAVKNKIKICRSGDINSFVNLKNRQLWPFGFLLSGEIKALWDVFSQKGHTSLLLAFDDRHSGDRRDSGNRFRTLPLWWGRQNDGNQDRVPIAGVLLLFYHEVAYYWLATASSSGKKLFAPSLLVWEAIKQSKKKGCQIFDFEGVVDARFPQTKNWAGFSKFKKGFGGEEVFYGGPIQKLFWPTL